MSQEPLWLPHLCLVLPTPTPSCDTFPLSSQVVLGALAPSIRTLTHGQPLGQPLKLQNWA